MFKKDWQDATATVIAEEHYYSTGDEIGTAGEPSRSKMVLEVHPATGDAFRSEVNINILGFSGELRHLIPPSVGEELPVSYDPKSHKVKVRLDPAHDRRLLDKKSTDRLKAAIEAPAGSGIPGYGDPSGIEAQLAAAGVDPAQLAAAGVDPSALAGATVVSGNRTTHIGGGNSTDQPQPVVSAAEVLATGRPATASLMNTFPGVGAPVKPGTTIVGIVMMVQMPGGSPYEAGASYGVPDEKVARLVPKVTLPVKVDRSNPAVVAVDWDAF